MTTTIDQPARVPELEAAKLYRQVRVAKVASERADADAAQAMSDAQTARHHYETLEAQYRAAKRECGA